MIDASFPKYDRYKHSGVEWLGEVPVHWEVEKGLRYFFETEDRSVKGDEELLSVSHLTGITPRSEKNITMFMAESYEGSKLCDIGDIAINTMWAWMAALGVSKYRGLVSPSYGTYRQRKPERFNPTFLDHLIRTDVYRSHYTVNSTGITTSRLRLYPHSFLRLKFICPPRAEQDRIVAFLDRKTAEIDALIAKKQRQIELLDEQKAILINRAVSRGLNHKAKLKSSGIKWIADIPEHWSISRLKHECSHIVDCPHATPIYDPDGEYPAIRTSDVSPGETHAEQAKRVGPKEFLRWTERLLPKGGDILYSREGDWGIAAPVPEGSAICISQRMMIFRSKNGIHSNFLMWQLNCQHVLRQGFFDVLGSTVPHVNIGTIANYDLVIPPIEEQEAIALRVQFLHQSFKAVSRKFSSQIDILKTLRSTLIAHAVTGRIKV